MENIKQEKNIFELFKQLVDLETNNAKVEAVIFAKKGSRLVSNKVNDMYECIVENAKTYGKSIELASDTAKIKSAIEANILRNYTLSLEKVNKQYDNKRKAIVEEKMRWQARDEVASWRLHAIATLRDRAKATPEYAREKELQEQARMAIDEGDYETLGKVNKELTEISKTNKATKYAAEAKRIRAEKAQIAEMLQLCDQEIKNCEIERRYSIDLIAGKKEDLLQTADKKYLLVLQNENWIQRTLGKILNKINGGKRYTENVTNVLSKKVRDIEYKAMPALKTKLQQETEQIINKSQEVAKNIKYAEIKEEDSKTTKVAKYTVKGAKTVSEKAKYITKQGVKLTGYIVDETKNTGNKITTDVWKNAKQVYNAMLGQYRSTKMWSISKMEQRISELEDRKQLREQNEKKQEVEQIEK